MADNDNNDNDDDDDDDDLLFQKSSITESWPCNLKNSEVALRYIIYRQPLSLDR